MRVVLVGATGAVGAEIMGILEERDLGIDDFVAVASPRSAGRRLRFRGGEVEVRALAPEVFDGGGIALFDVPDDVSREWAPVAVERGATVVDNSAAWRMDPDVPLVVPEVNPDAVTKPRRGIIASPNCTMLATIVPVAALDRAARLTRLICSSYQAASGAGKAGVDELWDQLERAVKEPDLVTRGLGREVLEKGSVFAHPLAMNVIPQIGSVRENGYTGEEVKVGEEIRKVMNRPGLPVTATCVRVPTVVGHGVSIHAEFERPIDAVEARSILEGAPGVEVQDDTANGVYPTTLGAAGKDPCFVGRIRQDPYDPNAIEMFAVGDNLRKGAALNTVQIAELLV
ncbi:MAG TPA: aspartate-semialdehyde dehydrogenase [Actinomycetota bacterium]|nr:aspartate-semialdehyde dehydrogenase [Actinomycetota bacterium]